MKGLELAERYYEEIGRPWLHRDFPFLEERICVGLAGPGSECFGFDDAYSRDHDFGPAFCMWLTDGDFDRYGEALAKGYASLPGEFLGFPARRISPHGDGRVGVLSVRGFYEAWIGQAEAPDTLMDWLFLPESYLAMATNGRVFSDPPGEFSRVRKQLLEFYPEDVRRKKIAARAAVMAQSGQYNYGRCIRRGEPVAAQLALDEFIRAAVSMVYLLNRVYTPFYKWMHRGMERLVILPQLHRELLLLVTGDEREKRIETVCQAVLEELRRQGLTEGTDDFLENHTAAIMERIADSALRELPVMQG